MCRRKDLRRASARSRVHPLRCGIAVSRKEDAPDQVQAQDLKPKAAGNHKEPREQENQNVDTSTAYIDLLSKDLQWWHAVRSLTCIML